jgi:hypothetical protein
MVSALRVCSRGPLWADKARELGRLGVGCEKGDKARELGRLGVGCEKLRRFFGTRWNAKKMRDGIV